MRRQALRRRRLTAIPAWLLALAAAAAAAQQSGGEATYPDRPIDLYIGSAPSGSTDALGRVLARALGADLGQPVVVHNAPGAGGAVMATQLKSSTPDGYTLGMTISHAYTGNPVVMPDSTTYTVGDFTHLASVSKGQCALVSSNARPYATLADVIADAESGREPVFASQSPLTRLVADYIAQAAGVRFRVITVQGGGEIMQAILGGHADFGFSGGPHVDLVAAGRMRVLASVEDARLITSPEVPTLRELGYDISSCSTFVVSAPPDLPAGIRDILATALERAIGSPPMRELIRNLRYPEYYLGPADVTRALGDEAAMLTRAVARLDETAAATSELPPEFMPYVAAALALLSLAWMLLARRRSAPPGPHVVAAPLSAPASIEWRFVALAAALLGSAFATMSAAGYMPGAALVVAGFMLLGRAGIKTALISAAVFPAGLWLLFSKLLGFPLP